MVYWGAPNIKDFAPGPNSFISALDFEGPRELAAYIKQVASNQTLYNSYFEWRKNGMAKRFFRMSENNFTNKNQHSWMCRLCSTFAERYCEAPGPVNPQGVGHSS